VLPDERNLAVLLDYASSRLDPLEAKRDGAALSFINHGSMLIAQTLERTWPLPTSPAEDRNNPCGRLHKDFHPLLGLFCE